MTKLGRDSAVNREESTAIADLNSDQQQRLKQAGLNPEQLNILRIRANKEVEDLLLPSVQFAIARHGKVLWSETFGNASEDTLYPIFSCTKAIMSVAAWTLIQEGKLDVNERVGDIVPEFDTNGKEKVRVIHLFLHTAGFPMAPFRPTDWNDRERRLERFSQWRLNWPTGEKFEYHPSSSMWVVAEIVERKSRQDFRAFIRERVIEPAAIENLFVGLPFAENERVAELVHVGDAFTSEDYEKLGIPEPPVTEVTEDAILSMNRSDVLAVGIPGGGGVATANAMALFYQDLLAGVTKDQSKILDQRTLEYGLRVISGDYRDPLYGVKVNRALGLCIAGDAQRNFRGFGHSNSESSFGHGGAGGQIAWADPKTGLSFSYLTNGHDRNPMRMGRRTVSISTKAAALCE
ncbi:MAG: serine hydrolase [Gammaproteobacteria bacterium]|nr:serine hydrolase [Gammaproteobacteria bacterium]